MFNPKRILNGLRNPMVVVRKLNRLYYTRFNMYPYNVDGVDVLEEDWDNLIILDACRYDAYAETTDLEGQLESRISRGAKTSEFIRANFTDKRLYDTVYVSANGWYSYLKDEMNSELHKFVLLDEDLNGDEEMGSFHPEIVTEHAKRAVDEYPHKRLIAHYVQPHQPYIGQKGREHFDFAESLPRLVEQTDAPAELIREAYYENLEYVLPYVRELVEYMNGRTVVTADHGEMLGERHNIVPVRDFGHHGGVYHRVLVEVPWHIIDTGPRREIVAEPPDEDIASDVEDNLQELGYVM